MHSYTVQGMRELLTPQAVKSFRQNGFIIAKNFFNKEQCQNLSAACMTTAVERGNNIFPGLDEEMKSSIQFTSRMESKASCNLGRSPALVDLEAKIDNIDPSEQFGKAYRKVHVTLKDQKRVDRLYRKLCKTREKYVALKGIAQHASEEEELSGKVSDERIKEIQSKYQYEDAKRSFEEYRDSGKMELEIRRDHHMDAAMEFLQNWPRVWTHVWRDSPELRRVLLEPHTETGEALGRMIGSAAATLTGELVFRLYTDSMQENLMFTNVAPFHVTALGSNFHHAAEVMVTVGLESEAAAAGRPASAAPHMVVLPGSHSVLRAITHDGREMGRCQLTNVFDIGKMARMLPEISHLPVVELPSLEPGTAFFCSAFLVTATHSSLEGSAAGQYAAPAFRPIGGPNVYSLMLMPDRCTFNGNRDNWASRDSHGPLYNYKAGQPLTDDAQFPVLYRALDIE